MEVQVLASRSPDHNPILVVLNKKKVGGRRDAGLFRIEDSWSAREDFKEVVHKAWKAKPRRDNQWETIKGKLTSCKRVIQIWVKKNAKANNRLINAKTKELEAIQRGQGGDGEEKVIKDAINELLEQEELSWKQRAKEEWLRHGDRNTKYFLACATQKRRQNTIDQIRDAEGKLCTMVTAIEEAFVRFYKELFTTAGPRNI
ncbi:uncharacterized protein LOC132162868 [Corylus avellana]|uniref:uncharacterized protein LOC132162868 n=1 Tax=Corylus avellana TaxID=13451 RepID=UPI00286B0B0E|nr:uncharacterized protein LOC132162868 [Corylus avellana]